MLLLYGRFSGDHVWPVLGVHRGYLEENECEGAWYLYLLTRELNVLVLDVENVSAAPVEITKVVGLSSSKRPLELTSWDESVRSSTLQEFLFPPRLLTPGEHIVVPMSLFFKAVENREWAYNPKPELVKQLMPVGTITRPYENDDSANPYGHPRSAEPSGVLLGNGQHLNLRAPLRDVRNLAVHNEYILGPSFFPKNIEGYGEIRPFSRSEVLYLGPSDVGSCPYAYVFDSAARRWARVGRLIPNRVGATNEGTSVIELNAPFDGRVLVKEEENELSFLDSLALVVELHSGKVVTIPASSPQLREADHSYLILKRGDKAMINFDVKSLGVSRIWLESTGYYLIDKASGKTTAGHADWAARKEDH